MADARIAATTRPNGREPQVFLMFRRSLNPAAPCVSPHCDAVPIRPDDG